MNTIQKIRVLRQQISNLKSDIDAKKQEINLLEIEVEKLLTQY